MAISSAATLVDVLRQHRLLEPAQLEEIARDLQARFPDPKSLAKELLARDWLTPFQANMLLQGRAQELELGSYLLLERVGEGGMGQVFKARQRGLGRIVAIKVMRRDGFANAHAIKRFQREVRAAAQLSHDNVVMALDADEVAGSHLLVMEYVAGAVDLAKLVKKKGPLPAPDACEFIRQAALGLQHAFERGMVHRDIKPANLLLTAGGKTIKILDMGLARVVSTEEDHSSTMTKQGTIMGTPDYIAPEQARDPHAADIRADIYSLGCTTYFLLTGKPPFPGGSLTEKLLKHQLDNPSAIAGIHPDFMKVIRVMMAKNPADRYQSPGQVASALQTVLAQGGATSTGPEERIIAEQGRPLSAASAETLNTAFAALAANDTARDLPLSRRLPFELKKPGRLALACAGGFLALMFCAILVYWQSGSAVKAPEKKDKEELKVAAPPSVEYGKEAIALLDGTWHYLGPFDNTAWKAFDTAYPPEKGIDLKASYTGKNYRIIKWKEYPKFPVDFVVDFLPLFEGPLEQTWSCIYLYREIDSPRALELPVFLGSDDTLSIWLNGQRVLHKNIQRAVVPDDDFLVLKLAKGKNKLLVKVCQGIGLWGFYISPRRPAFYKEPAFADWIKKVAPLQPKQQLTAVMDKLIELNPGFDGRHQAVESADAVVSLTITVDQVTDLSPVQALKGLKKLWCVGSSPGLGKVFDLAALQGLPLEDLNCGWTAVRDISPLKDLRLTHFYCSATKVTDWSPLKDMPLKTFWCDRGKLTDLSLFQSLPLEVVHCGGTEIFDLSPLKDMPLRELWCDFRYFRDADAVRSCKSLQKINAKPIAQFWQEVDARQAAFEVWRKQTASLPTEPQLDAVAAKLKELNPLFNGILTPKTADDKVIEIQFLADHVADLSPLRALEDLKKLSFSASVWYINPHLTDLAPLKGMSLTELTCVRNHVADLSPLRDMSLTRLDCRQTKVKNFALLKNMPLKELYADLAGQPDAELLRRIPTLATINGQPAPDFWRTWDLNRKKIP